MSCRSTPLSSAVLTLARKNASILTDEQCQSVYHQLQREYKMMIDPPPMSSEDYREVIETARQQATTDPLTERRKAKVLSRLNAADNTPPPAAKNIYAMKHLRQRASVRAERQRNWEARVAVIMGLSQEQVHEKFLGYVKESLGTGNGRQRLAEYSEDNRLTAVSNGLIDEEGTVYAMVRVLNDQRIAESQHALLLPHRIDRIAFPSSETTVPRLALCEAGYDERNGRLEVVLGDENDDSSEYAYRLVPKEVWEEMISDPNRAGFVWSEQVRGNSLYEYSSIVESNLESSAPRCPACGQFASTSHSCPIVGEPRLMVRGGCRQRWSNGTDPATEVAVMMPATYEFREELSHGPVRVAGISEFFTAQQEDGFPADGTLDGDIIVYRDEKNNLRINSIELKCSCSSWRLRHTCGHTAAYENAVLFRLDPPTGQGASQRRTAEEQARLASEKLLHAEGALVLDWMRNETTAVEARQTWRGDAEVMYSTNFSSFYDDYKELKGTDILPYKTDNVLDGEYTRESGNAFGVEIEYDYPDSYTPEQIAEANITIGRRLHELGLLNSPDRHDWHSSHSRGFRDTHEGNWNYERDGSVKGGEIISPGMYDEAETWVNIQRVCDVLKENGAIPSRKAGLHVHVGTGNYDGSTEAYAELARLFTQHEDVMYRLSASPQNQTHRPAGYCWPNSEVPVAGFTEVSRVRDWHNSQRWHALNFNNVSGSTLDHPEFRLFDASLDPVVIQGQVMLATGMTAAARRLTSEGLRTQRGKETVGSHHKRASIRGRRRITESDLKEDTMTFRSMLDTLYRRREDKKTIVWLFTKTKWMSEPKRATNLPTRNV